MAPYVLGDELVFPPPSAATEEGLVALGGDASPERLLLAYSQGIFPWPAEGLPLLWFSPDPRYVLAPGRAHIPRSLRRTLRREDYRVTADHAFRRVIAQCARTPRPGQQGTWITSELQAGYNALHDYGFAHSIEAWRGDELVGGLYGVSLGAAFFGESMFATAKDASKVAFATLVGQLLQWGFSFVDCQVYTPHLERFGAEFWPREQYLRALTNALSVPAREGTWLLSVSPRSALDLLER